MDLTPGDGDGEDDDDDDDDDGDGGLDVDPSSGSWRSCFIITRTPRDDRSSSSSKASPATPPSSRVLSRHEKICLRLIQMD